VTSLQAHSVTSADVTVTPSVHSRHQSTAAATAAVYYKVSDAEHAYRPTSVSLSDRSVVMTSRRLLDKLSAIYSRVVLGGIFD